MSETVAFYCVADARYFIGAVGMINSLRRAGHDEPVYVLDCGLLPWQRQRLEAATTVVENPEPKRPPVLLSTFAPLAHPADVMVLIDVDMLVNRHLGDFIALAAGGKVVAARDWQERFCQEWAELPGLEDARPGPYVSAGLVGLPRSPGLEILRLMQDLEAHIDFERTFTRGNAEDYPLVFADQDVLNAVLRARVASDDLCALDYRLSPMLFLEHLRPADAARLRQRYDDGVEPYVLHQAGGPKPWIERSYDGLYSRLLRRHLTDPGAAIHVSQAELPRRMRTDRSGRVERRLIGLANSVRGVIRS